MRDLLGKVRVTSESGRRVFVGIGPAADVDAYLANVRRDVATSFDVSPSDFRVRPGGAPTSLPVTQHFWAAQTVGSGTQRLTWTPQDGHWRVVVMNADGSANVVSRLSVGARAPHLLGTRSGRGRRRRAPARARRGRDLGGRPAEGRVRRAARISG